MKKIEIKNPRIFDTDRHRQNQDWIIWMWHCFLVGNCGFSNHTKNHLIEELVRYKEEFKDKRNGFPLNKKKV